METAVNAEIRVTEKAAKQIKKLKEENELDETQKLRIAVQGGGCSGMSYKLDFDNEQKAGDTTFNQYDVDIVVDGKSLFYLSGTELDFTDGLNGRGFIFNNPNATKTCGCGESFGV